jgi:hypothetical protein
VQPGEVVHAALPFLPTDHVFVAGHEMVLEIRGAQVGDWDFVKPGEPGRVTVNGAATALVLPTLDPATALATGPTLDWT